MPRYLALSEHLRRRFGVRVQKIPLDAGSSCPNRDGTLGRSGCLFCNPAGSGTGLSGLSPAEQWSRLAPRLAKKYKARLFLAYLQSFSNTYGPAERLAGLLDGLRGLPGLAGICLGTRPDCLDRDKLNLLARFPAQEKWLELGLQSASDATLARIGRGHDAASFAQAARLAASFGLPVCAHVVAGLPGETAEDFLATIDFLNRLPVAGIKFHNLYVAAGSGLETWWREGRYAPLSREAYLDLLGRAVNRLRPDVVVHRLHADPAPGELLAPDWAGRRRALQLALAAAFEAGDIRQGRDFPGHHPDPEDSP